MFKITINGDIEQTFKEVKKEIENQGGEINYNIIEVKSVELKYKINGNDVFIEIIDKPRYISEDYIEGEIKKYFNS